MKKIVLLSTGGTIAMKHDPIKGGLRPAASGEELVEALPQLGKLAQIELVEYSNLPSPHIGPKFMLDLHDKVDEILLDEEISGLVITHGTDTLEETAYFLDLSLETQKPVIITGAMRSEDEVSPDGPMNLVASVRTAIDENAKSKGVLVVMNQQIHSAKDVTKTHTSDINSFQSPYWGPLAYIDSNKIYWNRRPEKLEKYKIKDLKDTDVHLVKMTSGASSLIIDSLIENDVSGIVIEALGMGNVPPDLVASIKRAIDKKIPLILNSRCLAGRAQDDYGYPGGGKNLTDMGAIPAGDINGQKSRIKLIIVINSKNYDYEKLDQYFDN